MLKLAYIFPGQGTQFIGMGKSIYEKYPIARMTYDEMSEHAGVDIAKCCFEGPFIRHSDIKYFSLMIVATEVAICRAFMLTYQINPQFYLGHSIGEYAALICSGALRIKHAVKILNLRSEILRDSMEKGHLSILENISEETLTDTLKGYEQNEVMISCYNSQCQFGISGMHWAMEKIEKELRQKGAKVTPMLNSPPIHCNVLDKYMESFRKLLENTEFNPFRIPVVMNTTSKPFSDENRLCDHLADHLTMPVKWRQSVDTIYRYGVTTCIEMSPKNLLSILVKSYKPMMESYCYGVIDERDQIENLIDNSKSLQRDRIDFVGRCLGLAVSTKNNSNDNAVKEEVSKIYNQIRSIYTGANRQEKQEDALKLLIQLLILKKTPSLEMDSHIHSLLEETGTVYQFKSISDEQNTRIKKHSKADQAEKFVG